MTTILTFSEELHYKDEPSGIAISTILIADDKALQVSAKIDTGAEVCLFRYEVGAELGILVEKGIPKTLKTLAGTLEAYGHEIIIQTEGLAFQSVVYFAKYPGLPRNILGRQGWLRNIRIAIVDYENTVYLSGYE
jgi:hypothetical protein